MSQTSQRRGNQARNRVAARRAAEADRRRRLLLALGATAAVLAVLATLVLVKITAGPSRPASAAGRTRSALSPTRAPAGLVAEVTGVPAATLTAVGPGSASPPVPVSGQPLLTAGGRPLVVYVGAEFCPYCAAERWAMVQALSRFGVFRHLSLTSSSSTDVFPDTPTFTFHGSSYASRYLTFQPVETTTNVPQGGSYQPLDTPTAQQQQLLDTFDGPPYVQSTGAIPFVDLADKFIISGASYSPGVLAALTPAQVGARLAEAATPVAQGIDGSANVITAALCRLTGGRPGPVCSAPGVRGAAGRLHG